MLGRRRYSASAISLIATSLVFMALLLTLGLALCMVSTLSLNLARSDYLTAQGQLKARSAVADFIAGVEKAEQARAVELFDPRPLDLASVPLTLPAGCTVTFDRRQDHFSTDNSTSELWAAGFLDANSGAQSVPPFSTELIVNTRFEGVHKSYRAILRKVWPYSIYSGGGQVALVGPPDRPELASDVSGTVFVNMPSFSSPPDPVYLTDPRWALLRLVCGLSQVDTSTVGFTTPVVVGPDLLYTDGGLTIDGPPTPPELTNEKARSYFVRNSPRPATARAEVGNALNGSVVYQSASGGQSLQAYVAPGNTFSGSCRRGRLATDPIASISLPSTGLLRPIRAPAVFLYFNPTADPNYWGEVRPWESIQGRISLNVGEKPVQVLQGVMEFTGTSTDRMFYVDGSLVNRVMGPRQTQGIPVVEYGGGLKLEDAMLVVEGDLDLSNLGRESGHPGFKGISGNRSTLIVKGTLALTGAQLEAGDQGMVVCARDIVLGGGGSFNGLLVATNSITVLPGAGEKFVIRGGILAGGGTAADGSTGVVLRSVELHYDPKYLRSLNGKGEYQLTAWEAL